MNKRNLNPLDGTSPAVAVLHHAQSLAQGLDAEIVTLRVTIDPVAKFFFKSSEITASTTKEIVRDVKNYVEWKCSELETAGMRVSFLIREGRLLETSPAIALCRGIATNILPLQDRRLPI